MFTEKERYLANEASLASSLLGNGLNALRKADLYNKGLYYQAFFSLSIGLERLLKILVISQYRVTHEGKFPTEIKISSFKHDLLKLCDYIGIKFKEASIQAKLLSFLNDFAKQSRYYNFDSMIDQNGKYDDPLSDWNIIENEILACSQKKKTISNKQNLADLMDSIGSFYFNDLQGREITSAIEILNDYESREIIQTYSVQYMFQLIGKLVFEIRVLEQQKYMMPVLSEFFTVFSGKRTPSEIRKKKDWTKL